MKKIIATILTLAMVLTMFVLPASAAGSLAAPAIQSFSSTGSTITVKWNKVSGAKSYQVYRKGSSDSKYTKVATVTGTSYKDTDLKGTYTYKLKACSGKTTSKASAAVKSKTLKKPSIYGVYQTDQSYLLVDWEGITGATAYDVYYKIGAKGNWTKAGSTSDCSYVLKGKLNNKYYFKVRARYTNAKVKTYGPFQTYDEYVVLHEVPKISATLTKNYIPALKQEVTVTNNSKKTLRICNSATGFFTTRNLLDNSYSGIGREAVYMMTKEDYSTYGRSEDHASKYVDVAPGETVTVVYLFDELVNYIPEVTDFMFTCKYDGAVCTCDVMDDGYCYIDMNDML